MVQRTSVRLVLLASLVLAASAGFVQADKVTLKDGRVLEGTVTEGEGKVSIEMTYGTVAVPAGDVVTIERMPTTTEQLNMKLTAIPRSDPEALYQAAVWAKENGLGRRCEDLLSDVLALNAEHAGARRLLGHIKSDGKWVEAREALQLAQSTLEAAKYDAILKDLLPAMEEAMLDDGMRLRFKEIEAAARLRSGDFTAARKCYETLADKCSQPESVRHAAVAEILKKSPDGMYVVSDDYPAQASLLGAAAQDVPGGPNSLTKPAVLNIALQDAAKAAIKDARALMEEGKKLELVEPEAANARYGQAEKSFATADAVVPNIARSWRVEIARRRIAMIIKDRNNEAGKYDALMAELGKRDLTPAAYQGLLQRMLRALSNVRGDQEAISQIAAPFDRELVLEVADAKLGLQHVNGRIEILKQELYGK